MIVPDRHLYVPKSQNKALFALIAAFIAFLLFLTTLQTIPNGSLHPYGTDVGEIQNALPRWGTLHFPGYPLYSLLGSGFVSLLRLVGIGPATGSSLFSAMWGALSVWLLVQLCFAYDVRGETAVSFSLTFALATSVWVDASLAEVHTMTLALTLGALLAGIQFHRQGNRRALFWLALLASQAVLHQRAMVFLAPGLALLVLNQLKTVWKNLLMIVGTFVGGSVVYLYLPIRAWMGANWTFNDPGSWEGFWGLVFDTKTGRILAIPQTVEETLVRTQGILDLLRNEWPLPLLVLGLVGVLLVARKHRLEAIAISLIWLPVLLLSLIIWEGRLSDALLAVNLPMFPLAALGLALLATVATDWFRVRPWLTFGVGLLLVGLLFGRHRPNVLAITRDPGAATIIERTSWLKPQPQPTTLLALWGRDFWTLAYAQAYQGMFTDLALVDHNANWQQILDENGRILLLSDTFYLRPFSWWQAEYGELHLAAISPDVIQMSAKPLLDGMIATETAIPLGNGVSVLAPTLSQKTADSLILTLYWQADEANLLDHSVAIHLVTQDPPTGPQDIAAQADQQHPVEGWYPVSQWQPGEIVQDVYEIPIPEGTHPTAVRLAMYRVDETGQFINSDWLSLPLPTLLPNE